MDKPLVLALIPARGGSKGISKKNLRVLGDKPLIAHTIEEATKSKMVDRVVVSTDSQEIAETAKKHGAEVPFLRPKRLAEDNATATSVILHALDHLKKEEGFRPDIVVYLQPTSPFRKAEHIDKGVEALHKSDFDSVVGVREVYDHHPYFMHSKDEEGRLNALLKEAGTVERRQDLPKLYELNSALFITKTSYFENADEKALCFNHENMGGLEMEILNSVDIDKEFDLRLAEFLIEKGYV